MLSLHCCSTLVVIANVKSANLRLTRLLDCLMEYGGLASLQGVMHSMLLLGFVVVLKVRSMSLTTEVASCKPVHPLSVIQLRYKPLYSTVWAFDADPGHLGWPGWLEPPYYEQVTPFIFLLYDLYTFSEINP